MPSHSGKKPNSPPKKRIKLRYELPTQKELDVILRESADYYANEMLRFGEFANEAEAMQQSEKEVYSCLTQGVGTPGEFIYKMYWGKDYVGYVWYETEGAKIYLMYIIVFDQFKRQGIAEEAMKFYEKKAKELGGSECILYVFQGNTPAVELYKKTGYIISSEVKLHQATENSRYIMTKLIPSD